MKNYHSIIILLLGVIAFYSCDDLESGDKSNVSDTKNMQQFDYKVYIDSAYTYPGDSLYKAWLTQYNTSSRNKTKLSPEDNAFFSKQYTVKSTESGLLPSSRAYIYPGAILEGNSISDQKYVTIHLANRNPITVSMTLTHNTPKPTSRTINFPSISSIDDYIKEMVVGGSFAQSERFMFSQNRFTFYDEIKSAFGTNVDTKTLFSSKKESSTELHYKIMKSSGMYVKFFQSCFTINMDIGAPLANQPVQGNSGVEPVYVNSVTYGRMGVIVFETDQTYEFAETCIKKEMNRIFKDETTTLTTEERLFFDNTEFKILIMGADGGAAVQTVKGYTAFLQLIYNSRFNEQSYGVPISCSFSYANSHGLVETEFVNTVMIQPLFVNFSRENIKSSSSIDDTYSHYSCERYLNFYKDREKTQATIPDIDIVFRITEYEHRRHLYPNYNNWPEILSDYTDNINVLEIRNINFRSRIGIGTESSSYESSGPTPGREKFEPMYHWDAYEYNHHYSLESSPFFRIIY